MRSKKGQIWISAVLYFLIATVAVLIILSAGTPLLAKMKDKTMFAKTKDTMVNLDKHIQDVASEGQGSQRLITVELGEGTMKIENNQLKWDLDTETEIIEPRTKASLVNYVVCTNCDVSTSITDEYFILNNTRISVYLNKIGNSTDWATINTSNLIEKIILLENDAEINGTFYFELINYSSTNGTGYTTLLDSGDMLDSATVLAHFNTTNFEYDLELTLDSQADFLATKIKNFEQQS